jgi:hypothetical protein
MVPFDSDGDGVFDSLVLSATTKSIQVPICHSYDDMGIYDVISEDDERWNQVEVIETGGFLDEGSINDVIDDLINEDAEAEVIDIESIWPEGETQVVNGTPTVQTCIDPIATNYNEFADQQYNAGLINVPPDDGIGTGCVYAVGGAGGTQGSSGGAATTDPASDLQTIWTSDKSGPAGCHDGYCNGAGQYKCGCNGWTTQGWSSYKSTAKNKAIQHCQNLPKPGGGYYSTVLEASDFGPLYVKGNCNTTTVTNISGAFDGVKKKSTDKKNCCKNWSCVDDDPDYWSCSGGWTEYRRYRICFYCKG